MKKGYGKLKNLTGLSISFLTLENSNLIAPTKVSLSNVCIQLLS
jgi:hypothetical protein